jgi:hypothetical protein
MNKLTVLRWSVIRLMAVLAMAGGILLGGLTAQAAQGTQSTLTAVAGHGTGRVIVASTAAGEGTFVAEITIAVHDAAPNTTFSVQRAPDLVPDGTCTGTTYLPFAGVTLTTSAGGAGATQFHFERGAPFVSGTQFDVRFQVVGSDGTVLQSECMTVTVK